MMSRVQFDKISDELFQLDRFSDQLDYSLEAYNGYYGVIGSPAVAGIQGFISCKRRNAVSFFEVFATPQSVRRQSPELYGTPDQEFTAMAGWLKKLCNLDLHCSLEVAESLFVSAEHLHVEATQNRLAFARLFVLNDGLIGIFQFENDRCSGGTIGRLDHIYESDETMTPESRPATIESHIKYFR
jgi:hypothetical protein